METGLDLMELHELAHSGSGIPERPDAREVGTRCHWQLAGGLLVSAAVASLAACGARDRADRAPENRLLTVAPNTVSECGPETVVAKVSWDAEQLGIRSVRVEVGHLGNSEPKVFFLGDSKASMFTEQWVRIGTIFILVDGDTGRILASQEVRALPCL